MQNWKQLRLSKQGENNFQLSKCGWAPESYARENQVSNWCIIRNNFKLSKQGETNSQFSKMKKTRHTPSTKFVLKVEPKFILCVKILFPDSDCYNFYLSTHIQTFLISFRCLKNKLAKRFSTTFCKDIFVQLNANNSF